MWDARSTEEFDEWFQTLVEDVQVEVTAAVAVLRQVGPTLGRPLVDHLKGSKHANMKELRVDELGMVIRIAFAFDPERNAILLIGGNKAGTSSKRFYRELIAKADRLLDAHLARIAARRQQKKRST